MPGAKLTARELAPSTWSDFQRLFRKPGEWRECWCLYYQRAKPRSAEERGGRTREQLVDQNRREKRSLVEHGRAHGIIVYDGGVPVGWCQYGPKEETPRVDAGRKYRALSLPDYGGRLWRITCFCVDRERRGKGVASAALSAALKSISRQGGGVVEGYPVARRGALAAWFGTVSMFEREGFRVVAPFGKSNVLMRKTV